jgi:translation initiation factor IF-2
MTDDKKKPLTLTKKLKIDGLDSAKSGASSNKTIIEVKRSKNPRRGGLNKGPALSESRSSTGSRMRAMQIDSASLVNPSKLKSDSQTESTEQIDQTETPQTLQERLKELQQEVSTLGEQHQADKIKQEEIRAQEALKKAEEDRKKALLKEEVLINQTGITETSSPETPADFGRPSKHPSGKAVFSKKSENVEDDEQVPDRKGSGKVGLKTRKEESRRIVARRETPRRTGKLTVSQALNENDEVRMRSEASVRRARAKEKKKMTLEAGGEPAQKISRQIILPETITVQELANRMAERAADVIKTLMKMGTMATITQVLDVDTAELVATEFGHTVKRVSDDDLEKGLLEDDLREDTDIEFLQRPPVVTIMGHVDHGKTSLLDAMRSTNVVSGEAGGITQHIGAYQITSASGQKITFIDTPGHAAFTEMRSRGAHCTDIVILVVAADDGIKDQTVEAINHAKSAKVPIIVAINKIDKPEADPMRVKNELLQHELVVEDLSGDILCVEVSAKEKLNLENLSEAILLQAELLDLKAPVERTAMGVVIESRLDRGRGPVATVLVQKGTLSIGDTFVAGTQYGRVRAMVDDKQQQIKEATPAMPVEIIGFNGVPMAGDSFIVLKDEAKTKEIAEFRLKRQKEKEAARQDKFKKENLFGPSKEGAKTVLNIVIKSDAHGSSEAIAGSLAKINNEEFEVKIAHMGVGEITESDVNLAMASNALIVGFNVRANTLARDHAEHEGVQIRYYSIIYDLIDDVKAVLSGLLSPIKQEKFIGKAEVKQIFKISKIGTIAGCYVTEGMVKRGSKVRLLRDNVVIHEGSLKTLKRFKDEVKEVKNGYECGMAFENYNDLREGDFIECSEIQEIARTVT